MPCGASFPPTRDGPVKRLARPEPNRNPEPQTTLEIAMTAHDHSAARSTEHAAFVLRVALGAMFVAHALLKYFVFTLPGTAQFFGSLGLPSLARLRHLRGRARRRCPALARHPRSVRRRGLDPDTARCDVGACWQRLGVLGAKWRLGVSGVPDDRVVRAGVARRWRLGPASVAAASAQAQSGGRERLTSRNCSVA